MPDNDGRVNAVVYLGGTLYLGGSFRVAFGGQFTTVGGQNHSGVVQFSGAA